MTYFFSNPEKYQRLSYNSGQLNKLYNALLKDDQSEAVMAAMNILRKTGSMPKVVKAYKTEPLSLSCRQTGNAFFRGGNYNGALQMYNLAIGSAPKKSQAMVLAYSNRSALLQKIKAYTAALKDIETCLAMHCPAHIEAKLKLRKEECLRILPEENSLKNFFKCDFGKKFFNVSIDSHPQIPGVSKSVAVITENQVRKVIAAKEIPVGSIVGIETPFASNLDSENYYYACHFCHKFTFNLIPCDTCCETFFCSNECKETCCNEYHNIECQLIELMKMVFPEDCYRIPLKAALRMKTMATTWEQLISTTSKGFQRSKAYTECSTSELYDANNILSVFNISDDNYNFVYGQMYNHSFITATIIHFLEKIPGFFPLSQDLKENAVKTFSRILMHLIPLHQKLIMIQNPALIYPKMDVSCEPEDNAGLFSFTGKLKHACEPNLLVVGLRRKVALVALKTIPKGTELTISYVWVFTFIQLFFILKLVFNNAHGCSFA